MHLPDVERTLLFIVEWCLYNCFERMRYLRSQINMWKCGCVLVNQRQTPFLDLIS